MITTTQEPKYRINYNGKLVNRQSGDVIPDDEPVFILRARDNLAVDVLTAYLSHGMAEEHRRAVSLRLLQFKQFAKQHPDLMKDPDTTITSDWPNFQTP